MTIAIGELVARCFETYDTAFADAELATIATEVTLNEILQSSPRRPRYTPCALTKAA